MTHRKDRRTWLQVLASTTLLAAWSAPPVAAQSMGVPGRLQWVHGPVHVVGPSGVRVEALIGTVVGEGYTVQTGVDAAAHVLLADGALVALRADSAFTLVTYGATSRLEDSAALTLLRGALRVVTGWLGKTAPRSFVLHTSTATIGVRGTDFEVLNDGEDTHVRVHSGEVLLGNAQGDAAIGPGESAALHRATGAISRHGAGGSSAQSIFGKAGGSDSASDDKVNLHARNIDQHMETSLRESGILRPEQSLESFIDQRKAAVERSRERTDSPRKDAVLERMQDARDRLTGVKSGNSNEKSIPKDTPKDASAPSHGTRGGSGLGGGGGRSRR